MHLRHKGIFPAAKNSCTGARIDLKYCESSGLCTEQQTALIPASMRVSVYILTVTCRYIRVPSSVMAGQHRMMAGCIELVTLHFDEGAVGESLSDGHWIRAHCQKMNVGIGDRHLFTWYYRNRRTHHKSRYCLNHTPHPL